jgi:DHA1 family bicyclomycin/chloramphenicol resistance-like MFS transporter
MANAPNDLAGDQPLSAGQLALLAGLAALGALATNIMLPAFAAMAPDLGVAAKSLSWALSVFFIVFAAGQLVVGPLSDAVGRAPLVLGGLALFIAGSLVCATAPSLSWLIAGRAVQALGACAASVLARAIARDLYQGPALTRVLSLVMIAMAAAPGFSPALGTGMTALLGWRSIFVVVALAALLLALAYMRSAGETLPASRRQPMRLGTVGTAYAGLLIDRRFIRPAVAVSLIIGCLYSFFGAAPAILGGSLGFSPAQLSGFFAATVLVVFGGGMMIPSLARRWGAPRVGMAGILLALGGSAGLAMQGPTPTALGFMAAVTIFLAGMDLINPIGSAITLEPFGDRAGAASALLGFLQMGLAALGTALVGALAAPPAQTLGWVMLAGTATAGLIFWPVARSGRRAAAMAVALAPSPQSER